LKWLNAETSNCVTFDFCVQGVVGADGFSQDGHNDEEGEPKDQFENLALPDPEVVHEFEPKVPDFPEVEEAEGGCEDDGYY
jgi:hypothetical protein